MDTLSLISILLVPAGIVVSLLAAYLARREMRAKKLTLAPGDPLPPPKSGLIVLGCFAGILGLFGVYTAATHWSAITSHKDLITFAVGLLLLMFFGMFAQVIMSNHQAGRPPFRVSAGELLLPLVVAPIVFYPVWSTVASTHNYVFAVYCAFLNGYFWEGAVSKAKPDQT